MAEKRLIAEPIVTSTDSSDRVYLDSATNGVRQIDPLNLPINTLTQSALDLKADDSAVVHNTGNETIAGAKTFSSGVVAPSISSSPTISSGIAAPTSTPSKVGDIYVDTSNYKTYISKGTSSSADWIKQNGSYALSCGFTTNNPPASSTLYFGQCNDSYNDAATRRKIYPQRAGKISAVAGEFVNVASSSEKSSLYIRVNNTTDYLVSSKIATDTNSNYFSNNALSVPIADGDFFELKLVTPAWTTAPTSCRSFISVYVDL